MNPTQLSRELRTALTPDLTRRRWIIGLSLLGSAMAQIVSAYQTGLIKHLPDPPIALFNSDKVDASDYAYKRAQTPDGLLMLITYGVTTALAGAGGKARATESPLLPLLMTAKILYDVGLGLKLTQEEWADNEALCFYCQTATAASIVAAGLALPEALTALRHLASNPAQLVQR